MNHKFTLAIHGGAGTILKSQLTPQLEATYKQGLAHALHAGKAILETGGSALDAVTAAVKSLEDFELFNAGRGSVFTHTGTHEMDAAVMDGSNLMAGAVAGISGFKNPVLVARAVMEQTEHVMLAAKGAETFARSIGMEEAGEAYFYTEGRHTQWQNALKEDKVWLDHNAPNPDNKFGTVGAVAMDMQGNVAAATSTGGMTNKKFGRVGDSPIIGAGTYANNATCAVSATGHGEFFMRYMVAYDIAALMEYKGLDLQAAAEEVILNKLHTAAPESGGVIAADAHGNLALVFNSEGMYRGWLTAGGDMGVAIYGG